MCYFRKPPVLPFGSAERGTNRRQDAGVAKTQSSISSSTIHLQKETRETEKNAKTQKRKNAKTSTN